VRWTVKKGNTSIQDVLVKDKNDDIVENLGDATEIKFQIKKTKKAVAALVEKTDVLGIQVDTPSTGYLRITLTPTDTGTTLSVGDYFMAIQITWSPTVIYEVNMEIDDVKTERFRIRQDIV
jgi:hypothetical protein